MVSFCLMSGKSKDFFNLLAQALRPERWRAKAPHCHITSVRKFTKEARGHIAWIQQEQLTSKEGKTLFVALFSGSSLWANLCNVPAGLSKGAESRALSPLCLVCCWLSASLPLLIHKDAGEGVLKPVLYSGTAALPQEEVAGLAEQFAQEQEGPRGEQGVCLPPRHPSSAPGVSGCTAGFLQK